MKILLIYGETEGRIAVCKDNKVISLPAKVNPDDKRVSLENPRITLYIVPFL